MEKHLKLPLSKEDIVNIKAGDMVFLTGEIYTARDAAHKRIYESIQRNEELPIKIEGSILYYMGPSPARPGKAIGSAGPTTASRMDKYTPILLDMGLSAMIGKGKRSPEVKQAMIKNKAVYFAAIGGAGALLSKAITSSEIIAYEDLGTEAIRKLWIESFPVIVVIDSEGNDLYENIHII
ncbi:MAG: Fe-S-containing hydro-lyase [Lachnospiraceae bacterium]|nr:Fe-S-containing hydro-lyase [Lachnospiraceae bacterium]MDD3661416.1 Fe-S-containing hydro-lyase [Lachnospiraceae bacterium]